MGRDADGAFSCQGRRVAFTPAGGVERLSGSGTCRCGV
jgi:hypothetical protein